MIDGKEEMLFSLLFSSDAPLYFSYFYVCDKFKASSNCFLPYFSWDLNFPLILIFCLNLKNFHRITSSCSSLSPHCLPSLIRWILDLEIIYVCKIIHGISWNWELNRFCVNESKIFTDRQTIKLFNTKK